LFNNKSSPNGNRGQKSIENSLHGLAGMLALVAAFLVMPQIYEFTGDPVYNYLLDSYGDSSVAELGKYVWTFLATACVYFFSRAIFVLALVLIAQRLLMFAF